MRFIHDEPSPWELADDAGFDRVTENAIGMIEIEQMFGRVAFYEATNPDTIARYRTLQRARRKGARRSQGPKAAEQAARRSSRSTVAAARNLRRRKAVAP